VLSDPVDARDDAYQFVEREERVVVGHSILYVVCLAILMFVRVWERDRGRGEAFRSLAKKIL